MGYGASVLCDSELIQKAIAATIAAECHHCGA